MRLSIFSIVIILVGCSSTPDEKLNSVYLHPPLEIVQSSQEKFINAQADLQNASDKYKEFIVSNNSKKNKNNRLAYIDLLRNLVDSYNRAESILKEYPNSIENLDSNWKVLDRIVNQTFK